jgi:hypothetical protein
MSLMVTKRKRGRRNSAVEVSFKAGQAGDKTGRLDLFGSVG